MNISWTFKNFPELNIFELYEMLQLRQKIFIIEQQDIYLDIDDKDINAIHILGKMNNKITAYARILLPTDTKHTISFGRVIVDKTHRGKNLGKLLIQKILDYLANSPYKNHTICISAQMYLQKFYEAFGFKVTSDMYVDGTIPHVDMVWER